MGVNIFMPSDIEPAIAFIAIGGAMPKPALRKWANGGVLPEFIFKCFSLITARGMILHSKFSFSELARPGTLTRRLALFIQLLLLHFSIFGREVQSRRPTGYAGGKGDAV